MTSPWDATANTVQVLRGEEHNIVSVSCSPPVGDEDRFSIVFETSDRRSLRLRLPGNQLEALGRVLLDLANERQVLNNLTPAKRVDVEVA
jgi:hypothetical protein